MAFRGIVETSLVTSVTPIDGEYVDVRFSFSVKSMGDEKLTRGVGKALMTGSVLLVLVVELLNSAVEAAVDRISLDHHRLAKRAKDIGSAAVFISLVNVAAVWTLVLFG